MEAWSLTSHLKEAPGRERRGARPGLPLPATHLQAT